MIRLYQQIESTEPRLYPIKNDLMTFPGGEPHVKLDMKSIVTSSSLPKAYPDAAGGGRFLIDARVANMNDFGRLLVMADAVRRLDPLFVELFIPYFPGARQDRAQEGEALTAKVFADIINLCRFDRVTVVDPHSDVLPALVDNVRVQHIADVIPGLLVEQMDYLVAPDQGAEKKVFAVGQKFRKPVINARKHRDMTTGKLSGFEVMFPDDLDLSEPKHFLVVDDICDGGGTFIGLAEQFPTTNVSLHLWTTHGIYSKGFGELLAQYVSLHCSDSLWPDVHPGAAEPGAMSRVYTHPLPRPTPGKR